MEKSDHEIIRELQEDIEALKNRTRAMQTHMAQLMVDMNNLKEELKNAKQ